MPGPERLFQPHAPGRGSLAFTWRAGSSAHGIGAPCPQTTQANRCPCLVTVPVGAWRAERMGHGALESTCLHSNLDQTVINCVALGKLCHITFAEPVSTVAGKIKLKLLKIE